MVELDEKAVESAYPRVHREGFAEEATQHQARGVGRRTTASSKCSMASTQALVLRAVILKREEGIDQEGFTLAIVAHAAHFRAEI
jgi:hypothetical protein